ncbi:hypothetical protein GXW74_00980 [Roseomonas eburnea]|uniref:histidine kinase n=1 Tax=Neoroseomonas eburnea TaxID=1346889 RepID=A0A9X9X5R0_9PROT|nr:ATP-binding protein [Neoroseomonas eburnea]MBR0679046.1 hypothetical protein [Neoroseomonas eburnea]
MAVGLAAGGGALLAFILVHAYVNEHRGAIARAVALAEAERTAATAAQLLDEAIGHADMPPAPEQAPRLRLLLQRALPGAAGPEGSAMNAGLPIDILAAQPLPSAIGLTGSRPAEVLPLSGTPAGAPWPFGEVPAGQAPSGRTVVAATVGGLATALAWRPVGTTRFTALAAVPVPVVAGGSLLPWLVALLGGVLGALVALVLRGAAERRYLDAALARARRDHDAAIRTLAERQGLETLGRLTAGVAHEVGNVMQAVEFYLRAMPDSLSDKATLARLIERARAAARRGATGARGLLALARGSARQPVPIDVVPLLTEIADVMQELIGETFTVRLDLPPCLPPVLADSSDLEAMLINLATNSRDAMAQAGSGVLSISAALVGSPDASNVANDLPGGEWIRIDITDTGVGMDAETLARAMEPFFTTKPRGRGTGLGLALAREFAERSGGILRIESAVGSGTRASLFLHPASDGKVPPDADSPATPAEPGAPKGGALSRGSMDAQR